MNPPQQEAVETLSGPLLVLAGAGSGKTRVVTFRIANLIRNGVRPDKILAVTFTNKAAKEMQQRIGQLLQKQWGKEGYRPTVSTFHAYCMGVLRRHITILGYPRRFAIYGRGDQESLARSVLREIRVPSQRLKPSEMVNKISQWKSAGLTVAQAGNSANTDKEHLAAMGFRRYQKGLKNNGAVDFDDLLILTEEIFQKHPQLRQEEAARFEHLLIDEYQDTNAIQYRIVRALAEQHRNICVVGDDDQSIYAWRGAEIDHILRFARDWPGAKEVRLEQNYRSTGSILEIANTLIAFNKKRHPKTLIPARGAGKKPRIIPFKNEMVEAEETVAEIRRRLEFQEGQPEDFAILFRTNEQPRAFETELRRQKIPYTLIGGMSFFDRKEVRDILAYLKAVETPQDEISLLRIINTPPRGIGSKSVEMVMSYAVEGGQLLRNVLEDRSVTGRLPEAAGKGIANLLGLLRHFKGVFNEAFSKPGAQATVEALRDLIRATKYEAEINRLYDQPEERESRLASLEEIVNALSNYKTKAKNPTLTEFLNEVLLGQQDFDNDKEKQLSQNAITLMTLHSAKGLEFPHVYMVGMEEGILPHKRSVDLEDESIDEERRLCYVGITRAQESLTLSFAQQRTKWGKPRDTDPSRFLYEAIGKADNPHKQNGRNQERGVARGSASGGRGTTNRRQGGQQGRNPKGRSRPASRR
ncbi:MAG: exodeoxyribonuclease V subunit gamma [Pirellulaceae bacterium]|nr:exodeoxyribonuclease V subunit gamma [Pirellulaceae bacterium]